MKKKNKKKEISFEIWYEKKSFDYNSPLQRLQRQHSLFKSDIKTKHTQKLVKK